MKSIDIILPNYNSVNTISATIKSVLKQTYKNWTLIVIDDGSNELTKNILLKYKNHSKIKIFFFKKK